MKTCIKKIFLFCSYYFFIYASLFAQNIKDWSILICTLEERQEGFNRLYNKLMNQIDRASLKDKIEVLYFRDNRQYSIGHKRNQLLHFSKGYYINYIDDDDDIHDRYVEMIYEKLQKKPDCVSLVGIITFNGKNAQTFIHSLKYDHYFKQNNIYYRPPNHLNPMKRSVAIQFQFPEKNFGEDTDWTMKVAQSKLLQTEEVITEPYYFYNYKPNKKNI